MKRVFATLSIMLPLSFGVFAQDAAPATSNAEIEFEKEVHDFGNMEQGGDASTVFIFKNTGTEPLIISNAKGSCGCTVPEWPREPIAPGKTGEIRVKYDSKRVGPINKSVTVTSNANNAPSKVIRIKGNIAEGPKSEQALPTAEPTMAPSNN